MKAKHGKGKIWFTFLLNFCFFVSSSLAQGISKNMIEKALSGLRSGKSYNDLIGSNQVSLPGIFENLDEEKLANVKNFVKSESVQDKYLDENEYFVGPGDMFSVFIWGNFEKTYTLEINNEGNIVIPLRGLVDVKGKTLKESKILIKKEIKKIYQKKVEIVVVLSNIRQFKVYIVGEILQPGGYLANGMTRVSDIIEYAGGITDKGTIRNIEITNDLFDTRLCDIASFLHSKDMKGNPYIREGDKITIGQLNEFISIQGYVSYPDTYSVSIEDNLSDIIAAAGGLSRGADTEKIIVTRFASDYDSLLSFELSIEQANSFKIIKDDRILVCGIPDYRHHLEVKVRGEVNFPGVYPIRKDKTKLRDIIAMAGGITEDAFLKGSKIIRKYYPNVGDREFERVKAMPALSLTQLERSYLKTKLIEENGIVSLDFEELFNSGSDIFNIIVRDRDEITIARKSLSIKVTGSVVSPGLISFKENENYKYYIQQAGGYTSRSRKRMVTIIKGGTEIMLEPNKIKKLEAGDAIWIPEKEYRDRVQIIKDVLLIISSATTIIINTLSINRYLKGD